VFYKLASCSCLRHYRAVRNIPDCKVATETEVDTTQPQKEECLAELEASPAVAVSGSDEKTQDAAKDTAVTELDQPVAVDAQAPADSAPTGQLNAAAQKNLTQSSSAAYLYAVFPNLDEIIAENNAQRR